ncbi:nuclease domain-containing protein [Paenibacillus tepidiphilus]|uniref:nuclease domain-containing protein n=1 Tax=Paenibacillus tepidiphilus TaxID=2608683 RepID=UPI00123BCC54|nr:nuclease domain-containing protein [Paenibacillus tepidiphilus]
MYAGKVKEYKYVFDAKYRLNPAYEGTSYQRSYGQPGPEEEDINTMHRYRDGIVYQEAGSGEYERSMSLAVRVPKKSCMCGLRWRPGRG